MDFEADCKLVSLIPGWDGARHLRINSGVKIVRHTRWTEVTSPGFKFGRDTGAYPPKVDWRPLTDVEMSKLIGITDGDNLAATIQLFQIPDELRLTGLRSVEPYLEKPSAEDHEKGYVAIPEAATCDVFDEFRQWTCRNIYALTEEHRHQIGMAARLPGNPSSTGWEGLHIDIWGPSIHRQISGGYMGSRLVINLGEEDRHFIFNNLRLASMVRRYPEILDVPNIKPFKEKLLAGDLKQIFVGHAFLEKYSDYPVISVTLAPGQGYSAPTTSCLHDGYLDGMHGSDISLRTAHSGLTGPESSWPAPTYLQSWKDLCGGAV
jgi:hypothetical protein